MSDLHPPEGARLLREHVAKLGTTVTRFCEDHGIDRFVALPALNGKRKRVSVDFALAIERATDGAVPMASWATESRAEEIEKQEATETGE